MFKIKKGIIKTILVTMLVLALAVQGEPLVVRAASTTNKVPITGYTISTGRVNTYAYSNGKYSYTGYIDGKTDLCVIKEIKQDGYCQVKYPVKKGYKTAYTKTSNFLVNDNFSTSTIQIGVKKTAYRRSNLSQKIGTVYASDQVIVVGISGNNTQVIYPISNGYKLGWITGTYGVSTEKSASLATGYYQIKSAINTNYVLDVCGRYKDNGVNVQIYENQRHTNQVFIIKKQSDGYYTLTAVHSGKLLDVDGGKCYDGVNVQQWSANGENNQKWKIVKTSDGYYSLISKSNGLYLDVSGGKAANEVNVQCYTGNSTLAQKFVLQRGTVGGKDYTEKETKSSTAENKIQKLVNYEISQIGVGDVKGNNNVKYNTWYYRRTVSGSGYAWCQVFQSYCAEKVGVLNTAIPKECSCKNAVSWYKNKGQFKLAAYYGGSYIPKAGDLVFYKSDGRINHVGLIIASPVNGYLQVIEGNVKDSSTGNYTVQKFTKNSKRKLTNSYVYGYATPNYN
jgi:hypothetical protein